MREFGVASVVLMALAITLTLGFNTEWFGRGWTAALIIIVNIVAWDLIDRIAPDLDPKEKGE